MNLNNLNKEKIQELISKGRKMVFTKVLPYVIAATTVIGLGKLNTAKAAYETFPNVTISNSGNNEYANVNDYTSGYISDASKDKIDKLQVQIDNAFNKTYNLMANNAFDRTDRGLARFLAEVTTIKNTYENSMGNFTGSEKEIVIKYIESSTNKAKLVYASLNGLSVNYINEFSKNKTFLYSGSNVIVCQIQNNQIVNTQTYSYSPVANTNELIVMPTLNVSYPSNSTNPTFTTSFTGVSIKAGSKATIDTITKGIDGLYANVTDAIKKGQYNKGNNNETDVFMAIYGDTNLINKSITQKYGNLASVLDQYCNYKQAVAVSEVYKKNSINYMNYVNYTFNNYSVRNNESNGVILYNVYPNKTATNYQTLAIRDNGYIKTKDLVASGTAINPPTTPTNPNPGVPSNPGAIQYVSLNVTTNINVRVDGMPYALKDAKGNIVKPFIYKGDTYMPIRGVSDLFNSIISYSNGTVYLKTVDNKITVDANGQAKMPYKEVEGMDELYNKAITATIKGSTGSKLNCDGNDIPGITVFNINGTNFVPARACTEAVGGKISYNNVNGNITIYIDRPYDYEYAQPIYPEYPEYPQYPQYPNYPDNSGESFVDDSSDIFVDAMDLSTGQIVRVYLEEATGNYYIMNGSQKQYIDKADYEFSNFTK